MNKYNLPRNTVSAILGIIEWDNEVQETTERYAKLANHVYDELKRIINDLTKRKLTSSQTTC
ncbi:MAG: hypothetical protein QXY87_04890 [Saccharolobus sp.]|uniref:Uncharacterized protein n=2 Tax=Saccharolobus shibatae TaxID=2286 RepID=A0A8F5BQH7_SACSH|nr:hypothetical protein [Saccharolobus shibatae]MCH4815127.1 hypothetical protein [Saccharolobus shibatae]QXJ29598.1 hypothetical protein J5U23_02471 [Saccharolobus shibatae B12]QXJ35957.1 hypothetical protein J5U22_02508 [Saccharolobus shibatae]